MQIFFLCVILGLFHGLLFLPVALILLGKDNGDDDSDDGQLTTTVFCKIMETQEVVIHTGLG